MAVNTTAGAKFYIGPSTNTDTLNALSDSAALAFFEAITSGDWTEVEEVESLGDLGDNSEVATFASIADTRMRKFKTTRDAGTMAVVCGVDELDEGQIALVAAEKTKLNYAFRIIYADERDDGYSPTTDYFAGMVLGRQKNIGDVQAITKRTFNVAVNSAVYTDATDPTGS